ncbi:FHA domain-containing protein [Clostridium algidicarnis]|uniref:FHA domain protein n=2 Tax=Clostridium algidicarnis TaxID=37659 RepID=A0A2S6FYH3_9CLOT|nr:FHA domain-containing protein [Clostridium algidicarnis]MBB6631522.1 FHA domain-containing protein [Clostridium algidicarnis]MBB6697923.1 FHA domain-containing protein [Clostridium algidicarnis]MBU3193146.1 FHA domain-containing protein [Clostridium algidicarnis]MBU3196236.1 FHA domain-containing protein [Clostridium algidicarnis]MBU3209349.1 FHA domain-containing protein [Clostridium algidicarnis]
MRFNRLFGLLFTVIFIIILYVIIILALRIMYKDVKNGGKSSGKKKQLGKSLGLVVEEQGDNLALKKGSVIPIRGSITLGRTEENNVVLSDKYVSSTHAKIYSKNDKYFLEDLKSTNGTILNGVKINGMVEIFVGDQIQIGSLTFKVIG